MKKNGIAFLSFILLIISLSAYAANTNLMSFQSLLQNAPLETSPQSATHMVTIRGGVLGYLPYSNILTQLGFTPENTINKSSDGTMYANSNILFPTQAAVRAYVASHGGSAAFGNTTGQIIGGKGFATPQMQYSSGFARMTQPAYNGTHWGTVSVSPTISVNHTLLLTDTGLLFDGAPLAGGAGSTFASLIGLPTDSGVLTAKFNQYLLTSVDTTNRAANAARFTNMSTTINNFRTVLLALGYNTNPPTLTRNTPTSTVNTSYSNSYVINYSASDAVGMASSSPLVYKINGGSPVAMTSGSNSTLTGFTANVPATITVIAKNSTNLTTVDNTIFTYQTTSPGISISPTSFTFADTGVGVTSSAQYATVTNNGTADLVIGSITTGGTNSSDFTKVGDTCSGQTIIPYSTCTVGATMTPSGPGTESASISIPSNTTTANIYMSGNGITQTFLLQENFNTTSAPAGWTITGTPVYTPTYVLAGASSIQFTDTSNVAKYFTPSDTVYVTAMIRAAWGTSTGNAMYVCLTSNCSTATGWGTNSSGIPELGNVYYGGTTAGATSVINTSAVYIKFRYTKGTGSNGIVTLWSSPDGYTWTQQANVTNYIGTLQAQGILIGSLNGPTSVIWDSIQVSSTDILDARY